jgi:hypothetical protein
VNLLAEHSAGTNEVRRVATSLLELDFLSRTEALTGYLQLRRFNTESSVNAGSETTSSATLGLRYAAAHHWSVEAQWDRDLEVARSVPASSAIAIQLRYRL